MSDQKTTPPYAVELARLAAFTVQQIRSRVDSGRTPYMPDERDFEENFRPYVERIVLESEMRVGSNNPMYLLLIEKAGELDKVQKKIDALEKERRFVVRVWKNTGAVKP